MSANLLNRSDAPFDSSFWDTIDQVVKSVAQGQLSARKLLFAEGPFGLGLQFVPGTERATAESKETIAVTAAQATSLVQLSNTFTLAARDIEAHRVAGTRLGLENLVKAVLDFAAQEDALLYYGAESIGLRGLLNAPGVHHIKLSTWEQVGDAVESIIAAVGKLDDAGFHGPYSLGLSTQLYNKLFRRYPQTEIIELEHLKSLVTDGVVKAAAIHSGGVLLASGKSFASIILGQDLSAGFEGPSGTDYVFTLSETVALRLIVPQSVCVLDGA